MAGWARWLMGSRYSGRASGYGAPAGHDAECLTGDGGLDAASKGFIGAPQLADLPARKLRPFHFWLKK